MKAVVRHRYGPPDVLAIEETDTPAPRDGEVLIKVHAASVNPMDWHFMRGEPKLIRMFTGPRRPRDPRIGVDVAGRVEAVGGKVTRFKPGDEVFGACRGAFAEYACTKEKALAIKPANVTFAQAGATTVAALTALQSLRKGGIRSGQKVLINGASGGVGTFAVQMAKAFGAEVTGVCSTRNLELVRALGADYVVDYTRDNFTTSGQRYDLMIDCVASQPLSKVRRILAPNGVCMLVGSAEGRFLGPMVYALFVPRFKAAMAKSKQADLDTIADLMARGKVTPAIDKVYPLSEAADAVRHLETGHARGKVVIAIA
jgi:NADPH:quinone reductase-like Zn-dependent oxidoreductase